jgi:hypothetical protein
MVKERISIQDWCCSCLGYEKLLDNSNDHVASNDELHLIMELSLRYTKTILAPQSSRRKTTAYLQSTATTFLSTKKIVSPQCLVDSQEPQQQQPVVAQPEQRPETTQINTKTPSQTDAQRQPSVSIQVKPVVENKAARVE